MKIAIVGLGLIGGSIAKKLSTKHIVEAIDLDKNNLTNALNANFINRIFSVNELNSFNIVFLCLPPKATIKFLKDNAIFFGNAYICDVCGIKDSISSIAKDLNLNYIGYHPMAGKEVGGFINSADSLFKNKNLVVTDELPSIIQDITKELEFASVIITTPQNHDKTVTFTSQLPHIISNCYAKSCGDIQPNGYTGGSFEDLIRVGELDSNLWTDLFNLNKKYLLPQLKVYMENLNIIYNCLQNDDLLTLTKNLEIGSKMAKILKNKK